MNVLEYDVGEALAHNRRPAMTIWSTQEVHDAVMAVLPLHAPAANCTHALIEVGHVDRGTTAALMRRSAIGVWEIDRLYTAEHSLPGEIGVLIIGLW